MSEKSHYVFPSNSIIDHQLAHNYAFTTHFPSLTYQSPTFYNGYAGLLHQLKLLNLTHPLLIHFLNLIHHGFLHLQYLNRRNVSYIPSAHTRTIAILIPTLMVLPILHWNPFKQNPILYYLFHTSMVLNLFLLHRYKIDTITICPLAHLTLVSTKIFRKPDSLNDSDRSYTPLQYCPSSFPSGPIKKLISPFRLFWLLLLI